MERKFRRSGNGKRFQPGYHSTAIHHHLQQPSMSNPVSTYRLQFHKDFNFEAFEKVIPYLQKLGVSTIYASPIFESTPGSTHGYDGLNPHQIDPEIGTEEQLKHLSKKLNEAGMQWLQDIVPNHLAFDPKNPWLNDVLEKGLRSVYAAFFDTSFSSDFFSGRLMVPFLDDSLEETIKKGELKIAFKDDRLVLNYFDANYPLTPRSYASVLLLPHENSEETIRQLVNQLEDLEMLDEPKSYALRWNEIRLQLASILKEAQAKVLIEANLQKINQNPELLLSLAEEQHYRLCSYKETSSKINFRRFFTVNTLICLNIQNPEVFETYHLKIKELVKEGVFQGLRIDHIDGLYNPTLYLKQLREMVGEEAYIVVEKILEAGETLPQNWPIEGTSGYDFLALVNNLFTDKNVKKDFNQFYQQLAGEQKPVQEQIREKKTLILDEYMGGELDNLYHYFLELNLADPKSLKKLKTNELKNAIAALLIDCPVYRFYGNEFPLDDANFKLIKEVLKSIRKYQPELELAIDVLEKVLLHPSPKNKNDFNTRGLLFYQRLMQFTGPLMAKGVEDTLMYTYNRFIGHSEVGDAPDAFGISVADFHRQMQEKQEKWPLSINATSTHDTKRGEGARARLNALSDLAEEWFAIVKNWQQLNNPLKTNNLPDANDEYFIYETLIGTYPMPGEDEANYPNRLQEYIVKALREGKQNSGWGTENEKYETATAVFIDGILDQESDFWQDFKTFHQKVVDFGIVNSLSQVLLKFTCPGVPDVYQGCENWDLSMVDPDNRRPVDYEKRLKSLEKITGKEALNPEQLWEKRYNADIKLNLIHKLFKERKAAPEVFLKGKYTPLTVKGKYKENIFAFARNLHQIWYITIVPLGLAKICEEQNVDIKQINWKHTRIILPKEAPAEWNNLLDNANGSAQNEAIEISELFGSQPHAFLKMEQKQSNRNAGILMHLTSLPSAFGIGDLGPEAKAFAKFLYKSKQQFWQLLPLNPTGPEQSYSPYSSVSSIAGNTLLISPELLAKDGLLKKKELKKLHLLQTNKVNFEEARQVKDVLFEQAYENFCVGEFDELQKDFDVFAEEQDFWLNDFTLYTVLKQHYQNKAWFSWPEEFKKRDAKTLAQFSVENQNLLQKEKWLQFIFFRQWKALKNFCHKRSIQLLGDLPFYISYDSVDVWSQPELFSLDKNSNMIGVAGVPPDYFNADGQLWGMPVFCWDALKASNYAWWVQRIRKNMELFDMLRLDHFRAFADYWEVPAAEKTAINGEWKTGPGSDFFKILEKEFVKLPFVAEDLGEITDAVYHLRDEFKLPGMKVLQFAFGDDMPGSIHIPHNYPQNSFAYTGTHDNNTITGWFTKDADKQSIKKLKQYVGTKVTEGNVHWILIKLAYASVAKTVIIPMQDVLGFDEKARMNTPASTEKNWSWRMQPGEVTLLLQKQLRKLIGFYYRV
ncbi:MAG: malto-oligosyltrehalose synthase [Janthinobacterium lividum]